MCHDGPVGLDPEHPSLGATKRPKESPSSGTSEPKVQVYQHNAPHGAPRILPRYKPVGTSEGRIILGETLENIQVISWGWNSRP
jgi:hypothetical protein